MVYDSVILQLVSENVLAMKDVALNQKAQARCSVPNCVLEYQVPIAQSAEVELVAERHEGANYTHLTELLREWEGIDLIRPTVRRILTRAGIGSPRSRRSPQHHFRQQRMPNAGMPNAGMLIPLDGSHHAWLEDRGPKFALLLAVDDDTSAMVNAVFFVSENTAGYFTLLEGAIEGWGIPLALSGDPPRGFQAQRPFRRAAGASGTGLPSGGSRSVPAGNPVLQGHPQGGPGQYGEARLAGPATAARCRARQLRRSAGGNGRSVVRGPGWFEKCARRRSRKSGRYCGRNGSCQVRGPGWFGRWSRGRRRRIGGKRSCYCGGNGGS